jgi:outer membrane receptor protein involved in Fe transport
VEQPSYTLLDLRAGFLSAAWEFSAYIDNLTDERAVVYHDTGADLFWGRDNLRTLRPRVYGVSLRRYFR